MTCFRFKNTPGWRSVVFCTCKITQLFYVVRAVHEIDVRLFVHETSNKRWSVERSSCTDSVWRSTVFSCVRGSTSSSSCNTFVLKQCICGSTPVSRAISCRIRSGHRISVDIFHTRPDRSWGPHPGHRVSFPGVKRPGPGFYHPSHIATSVPSSGPSCPVLQLTLTFYLLSCRINRIAIALPSL